MVNTWSSCVEFPMQRLFLALSAEHGLKIFGCDIRDAYAHTPAPYINTYLQVDDAYRNWYRKKFNEDIGKRMVLPIQNCLQGHPSSGHLYMKLIDKILGELGFTSTVHDRCIYRAEIDGKLVLAMRQVDDFLLACEDEQLAKTITTQIGVKIRFKSEEEENDIPITFMGLVDDCLLYTSPSPRD